MWTLILIVASIILWVVRTIQNRKNRTSLYCNLFLTGGIIIFWLIYLFVYKNDPDKLAGLAAVAYILYGFVYWKA